MKLFILLINVIEILVISLLISGCKKQKAADTPPLQFKLIKSGLEYVQIPLNRYFIYKDSATTLIDSVVVTESQLENRFVPKNPNDLFSYPALYTEIYSLTLTKMNGASGVWLKGATIYLGGYSSNDSASIDMREPNNQSMFAYFANTLLYTITIESKTYTNVVIIIATTGTDPSASYYLRSVFYWAKGVGIIRLERETSTTRKTYTLLRNN